MKIKNILISQPKPIDVEKSPYGELIKTYELNIDFQQFIKVEAISAKDFRKDKINILDYTAVIFTSRHAADHFFRICEESRIQVSDTMKYFCVSESIAFYLQKYVQYRKRKIFYGNNSFLDLFESSIKKHREEKFLLPCSDDYRQEIPQLLTENAIFFSKAIIYKTVSEDLSGLIPTSYDMLVFFSPAGVKSLIENFPTFKQGNIIIAAFGANTEAAIKEAGLSVHISAPTKTAPSMTMAIEQYLQKIN